MSPGGRISQQQTTPHHDQKTVDSFNQAKEIINTLSGGAGGRVSNVSWTSPPPPPPPPPVDDGYGLANQWYNNPSTTPRSQPSNTPRNTTPRANNRYPHVSPFSPENSVVIRPLPNYDDDCPPPPGPPRHQLSYDEESSEAYDFNYNQPNYNYYQQNYAVAGIQEGVEYDDEGRRSSATGLAPNSSPAIIPRARALTSSIIMAGTEGQVMMIPT